MNPQRASVVLAFWAALVMTAWADPPANDAFLSPTVVAGFPAESSGLTTEATLEAGEPTPHGTANESVWFRWTSPITGDVQMDIQSSSFGSVLAVWSGDSLNTLTLLADSYDKIYNQNTVFFHAVSGATYQAAVYDAGSFVLHITNDITSKISGVVTGPGGVTPIPNIKVSARFWIMFFGWAEAEWDTTDGNGEYTIRGLQADTFRVSFYDPSGIYAAEAYSNAPSVSSGEDILVPVTTTVSGINASLDMASKITGTVTRLDGITPVWTQVVPYRWNDLTMDWEWIGDYFDTDSSGNYSIEGVWSGTYRIWFTGSGQYVSEYYDNAPDFESATDITVPTNATVTINATLADYSEITGTVTGPDEITPLEGIDVTAYSWDGSQWNYESWDDTDSNGNYIIGGLTTGTNRIEFSDSSGIYLGEVFNDKPDLNSGDDIIVGLETTVPGINASLALVPPSPPEIVEIHRQPSNVWDILFTANVGVECVLQGAPSPANGWEGLGGPVLGNGGTNVVSHTNANQQGFYRIQRGP